MARADGRRANLRHAPPDGDQAQERLTLPRPPPKDPATSDAVPASVLGNIETVIAMERQAARGGPRFGRLAHRFGTFVGSTAFLSLQAAVIAAWLLLNSGIWPRTVFDPYPFDLLGVLVSTESVLLTTFVLIKQNREGERAGQRSHLDLQVNLLAEKETTKILQLVQRIADKVGVELPRDEELDELMAETAVANLAEKLENRTASGEPDEP